MKRKEKIRMNKTVKEGRLKNGKAYEKKVRDRKSKVRKPDRKGRRTKCNIGQGRIALEDRRGKGRVKWRQCTGNKGENGKREA